jgi:hypothetical protein
MYTVGQAFRCAVTKGERMTRLGARRRVPDGGRRRADAEACDGAWQHWETLEFLTNLTGIKGVMASAQSGPTRSRPPAQRVAVLAGLTARTYMPRGPSPGAWWCVPLLLAFVDSRSSPPAGHRHNSSTYPEWMWMGEESSDQARLPHPHRPGVACARCSRESRRVHAQLTGHFFAYPVVYDLVADTPERQARVATLTKDIVRSVRSAQQQPVESCTRFPVRGAVCSYIVDNGLVLIDITGARARAPASPPDVDGAEAPLCAGKRTRWSVTDSAQRRGSRRGDAGACGRQVTSTTTRTGSTSAV